MIDQVLPPYEWGKAESGRDVATWTVIAVLVAVCAVGALLTVTMVPGPSGSGGEMVETPIPTGVWSGEWTPNMQPPVVAQQQQVRALMWVGAGTSGLLAGLCFLVVAALWAQRLRLRRDEHFVHWAVGANRWQLFSRLLGEARLWVVLVGVATALGVASVVAVIEHTFPGSVNVSANARASLIVLTGFAVLLGRWETLAALGPVRFSGFRAYELLGSPWLVGAVGVAILSGVGLLAVHAPYDGFANSERDGLVIQASLAGLTEEARRQELGDLTERLSATGERIGLTSTGALRGAGHKDAVSTECGRCFEGLMLMPIKHVRADVHAVAQDTFTHLGIQVIRGRDFDNRLDGGAPSVAIVSRALANRHFERGEALGRRVRVGYGDWLMVVGVVEDATDVRHPAEYAVYVPVAQAAPSEVEVLLPQSENASLLFTELGAWGGAVAGPRSRAQVFAVHGWFRRLLAVLGAVAMLILAVGLWVAATNEANATRFEVGLRRAVGGRQRDIRRFYVGFLASRLGAALLAGAWLSLFLGAGLERAYGAIPQFDVPVSAAAGAWVCLIYLGGSIQPFRRACRAPLMENL